MNTEVSDVIYPESHLNSPLVAGKIVLLLELAELPHNQILNDDTLIKNLNHTKAKTTKTAIYKTQQLLRTNILQKFPNFRNYRHIPYPECNTFLFAMTESYMTRPLQSLMNLSSLVYTKIGGRIIDLYNQTNNKLGLGEDFLDEDPITQNRKEAILNLPRYLEGSRWYKSFLFWFTVKTEFRNILKNTNRKSTSGANDLVIHESDQIFLIMNRNLCCIYVKTCKRVYYLTFEMVLMYSDVIEGRLMTDLIMTVDPRFMPLQPRIHNLWKIIDDLFIDLGNSTYELVAIIEPFALAMLQLKDASKLLRGAFLEFCLSELDIFLKDSGYLSENNRYLFCSALTNIFQIDDIHLISEFFSFFRSFGHPVLEAQEAAKKVREHMNKPKLIKFQTLMKGHAIFCGTIINGYRDNHSGVWPPCELPQHSSKQIKLAKSNNEALTPEICANDWKSFVGFHFKCFMPLTLDEDLTMYMKDKALASIKSEWDSCYPDYTLNYHAPRSTTSRRLIEVFLKDEKFDPYTLIDYVISGKYLNDEEFNLSYSLKEKEIKQVGRLFAKMTYQMRACQVVAESLIATGVGKYFRENGMVKDEHDLLKTLHKLSISSVPKNLKHNSKPEYTSNKERNKFMSNPLNQSRNKKKNDFYQIKLQEEDVQYETVSSFLTTDLQKFCLNWRAETTNIFAERLNEIYGLPGFFNWLHRRLERSVVYVADPHCPPSNLTHIDLEMNPNDHLYIKYPMGGPEGYSQKLWTIITIPFLFLSAYEVGAKIAALVQGDNQAIAITKRVHPNLPFHVKKYHSSVLAQKYFLRLRKNMADIGHNLKANETIISSHFFVYSKRIYYDGLVLSQALKPISRVCFWSETLVDETRSACSNISTAIAKSIEQGLDRWIGYSLNILKTLQQLLISLKFTINPTMTDDITDPIYSNPYWLLTAAILPAHLGGFNYMNLARLYVRNIGDPVTASLADLKRLIKSKMLNFNMLWKVMLQTPGTSDFIDWASDPYSINIPNSQSVTTLLKNITSRSILQNSVNPMLKDLFHSNSDQEDRDLARFLLDRPIIVPRAAHEIMDKSLTGARQEIAGMLDTTKGLIRNSVYVGGIKQSLVYKISTYDYEQFRIFNNLMRNTKEDCLITLDVCALSLAIQLRKRMWFHLSSGRPIYGLEVPDILEVSLGYMVGSCEECNYCCANNENYGWFYVPNSCQLDNVDKESNAIRVPYFGSTTEERSEIKIGYVRTTSRALKASIRIATVYTWAYGDDDESWYEAWYLASSRANISLEELKSITPISTSNNIAHRLRDKSTQMKYSSSTLNRVSRYTVISNDKLNFIIDGKKVDTNLVYQQIMLLGLSVLEGYFRYQKDTGVSNTVYHLHIEQNCCIREMNDHPYLANHQPLPELTTVVNNRLVYDDSPIYEVEKSRLKAQYEKLSQVNFPRWDTAQLNTVLAQSLGCTLIEIITKETKDHLNVLKVLSLDDDVNSLITEFLLVSPQELSLHLGLCIAINWAYDIYYRRPQGKYQMIEFLESILSYSSRSTLRVLENVFSHQKIFERFWSTGLVEPIYGPNLSSQNFNKIAIQFLVNSYSNYLNYWLNQASLDFIITESCEEIIDQRYEVIQARHYAVLSSLYLNREDMIIIRGMTSLQKMQSLQNNLENYSVSKDTMKSWNLKLLPVKVYPTSLTYLRRGTIKHLKLRACSLGLDIKGLTSTISVPKPVIEDSGQNLIIGNQSDSIYFPAFNLFSDSFVNTFGKHFTNNCRNKWEMHVLRRMGINSTSCYKALEISEYLKPKIDPKLPRLFLGEGSGAMMTTYYFSLGRSVMYYNTGVLNSDTIGQRVLGISPSEMHIVDRNSPNDSMLTEDLKILFNGKPESTWIGQHDSFSYIMGRVEKYSLGLIHNDMESSCSKDSYTILREQIFSLALAYNLGSINSIYVTKIAPRSMDYTYELLLVLLDYYDDVFCFIPSFSNPYTSEIYLICSEKKERGFIIPDILLDQIPRQCSLQNSAIQNNIINIKLSGYFERRFKRKLFGDYSQSLMSKPTPAEVMLSSYGFQFNGPKVIKEICNHDVGTGNETLKESIHLLINLLITRKDNDLDQFSFFDPYPIKEESQIREILNSVIFKIVMYFILYGFYDYPRIRDYHINNLRRKVLLCDLSVGSVKHFLPPYLIKKYKKLHMNRYWSYELSTDEVKKWWKAVGYSLLL